MFKKIVSTLFATILIVFSAMTLVSCATTEIAIGLQRLFYKNAKIASFAAASAILNDKDEAEAVSSDSVLKGGTIGQQYLMNKYSKMTVDSALGKDFLINQTGETKMDELFESTFGTSNGKTNYTYTNSDNTTGNRIIADNTTGYTAGTKKLDGINSTLEPVLDLLTTGISPATLSTLINLFFQEKIDLGHEIGKLIGKPDLKLSFSDFMKEIENPDSIIHEIMNNYVLDYQTEKEMTIEETMKELENQIKQPNSTVDKPIQFIKMTLKTSYNFFDDYLKGSTNSYQYYISNVSWTNGLANNIIDFSKLSNLLKYATTSDADKLVAKKVAQDSLFPKIKPVLKILLKGVMSKLVNTLLPVLIKKLPDMSEKVGNWLQTLLINSGVMDSWKEGGGVKLVETISDLINQLLKYLGTHNEDDFNKLVDTNIKSLIKEITDLLSGMNNDFYQKNVRGLLEELAKAIKLPDMIVGALKDKGALVSALKLATGFLWGITASKPIKNALKPILENLSVKDLYDKISSLLSDLVLNLLMDFDFTSIFDKKPLSGIDEKEFLSKVGDDESFMPLIGAFRNLSIENIAKFLADRLEPMSKESNITFNLNTVSELLERVKNTRVINGNQTLKLSEFTTCEDPYNNKCNVEWETNEIKFVEVDKEGVAHKDLFKYDKESAPIERQKFMMTFGLDQMGSSVAKGSIGDTVVKMLGKDSGELLYSLSTIIQDILIKIPSDSEDYLNDKYLKPLYQRSNWTMDEFIKFKKSLPTNVDKKNPEFSFKLYRKLPGIGSKTYIVTMRQGDNKYWKITNITK